MLLHVHTYNEKLINLSNKQLQIGYQITPDKHMHTGKQFPRILLHCYSVTHKVSKKRQGTLKKKPKCNHSDIQENQQGRNQAEL